MIKGNNQIIAHNTVINTINNRNDIIILAEDCSNTNTWMYNNLAERIGSHRSDVLFSAPSNGPMPIGTEGYIKNGIIGRFVILMMVLYILALELEALPQIWMQLINLDQGFLIMQMLKALLIIIQVTVKPFQIISQLVTKLLTKVFLTKHVSTIINQTNQLNSIVPHSSWIWNRYWCHRWKLTLDSWSSGMDTPAKYKPRRYISIILGL